MTSKAQYLLSRHKSLYDAAKETKCTYTLRPIKGISKVHKNTPSVVPACRKKAKICTLQSVNIKRNTTPQSVSNTSWKKKVPKKCISRKSNNNEAVSDFIGDVDLTSIIDMEADAFQLASYVESSNDIDQIINDLPNDDLQPQPAPSNYTVDPLNETGELREMRLEELLDLTIKELQKATNANPLAVDSIQSNIIPNQMTTTSNIAVDNCSSKRNVARANARERASCQVTGQVNPAVRCDRNFISPGNSSHKRRHTVSEEPSAFRVPPQLRTRKVVNRRICMERESSTAPKATPTSTSTANICPGLPKPNSNNAFHQTSYTKLTKKVALKQQMIRLFNRACYHYLNGRPCRNLCKYNHSLPPVHQLYHKLMQLSDDTVTYTYLQFILRNTIAFDTYFATMCEVLGKRKMHSILLRAVRDCENRDKIPFFKDIYQGLLMAGSSKRDALTTICNICCKSKECYDVFLEIIIDTNALHFIDLLSECYLYGTIGTQSAYKLLQQVSDDPGSELLPVFVDILDKYSLYGGFDTETFRFIIPRVENLVVGNLSLTQQLKHIAKRIQKLSSGICSIFSRMTNVERLRLIALKVEHLVP